MPRFLPAPQEVSAGLPTRLTGACEELGMSDDAAFQEMQAFLDSKGLQPFEGKTRSPLPQPPVVSFDATKKYFWEMTTTLGPVKIRLMPDVAPMHCSSTLYLNMLQYYTGLSFHRVIPGFMAQGGCPTGTGTGGPGYQYDGECSSQVRHDKPGLLSMANAGPGTDGSQFFLTFVATPWLDGKHTIFGEVVDGMATLQELEKRGSDSGQPREALAMTESRVVVE